MSHHYPNLPVHLLHFSINEDTFHNGREIMDLLWPFLEKYRNESFKISDLANFFHLSGEELYQFLDYLLHENLAYFSTSHLNFESWQHNRPELAAPEVPAESHHDIPLSVKPPEEIKVVSLDIT